MLDTRSYKVGKEVAEKRPRIRICSAGDKFPCLALAELSVQTY